MKFNAQRILMMKMSSMNKINVNKCNKDKFREDKIVQNKMDQDWIEKTFRPQNNALQTWIFLVIWTVI